MKFNKRMSKSKVLILATKGLTTDLLYQELSQWFEVQSVVIEDKISPQLILKNRAKKLGWWKVMGQAVFVKGIMPFLSRSKRTQNRINDILEQYGYSRTGIPSGKIKTVHSVNSDECIHYIQDSQADLIFINGTRIISSMVLNSTSAPFINIHVGITPKYRGVHGGYWALYHQDKELFGVTLHQVDAGVDTGQVIDQAVFYPEKNDHLATYPILQYVEGLKLIRLNQEAFNKGQIHSNPPMTTCSRLHYHPTVIEYIKKRFIFKIK